MLYLQAVMAQVLAHAPHGQLPEELQWTVRMLLPREGSGPGFTTAAAAGNAGAAMTHTAPQTLASAGAVPAGSFGGQAQGMAFAPQQLAMMQQVGAWLVGA